MSMQENNYWERLSEGLESGELEISIKILKPIKK